MIVQSAFSVAQPLARVFAGLADPATIIGCLPGARPLGTAGEDGVPMSLRLTFGSSSVTYRGTLQHRVADAESGAIELRAVGVEARGNGELRTTLDIRLRGTGDTTAVAMQAEVEVTGRAAEIDEAVRQAAVERLLGRFGATVSGYLGAGVDAEDPSPPVAAAAATSPEPEPETAVRGTVTLMTETPLVVDRDPSLLARWRERLGEGVGDRPWLVPAVIVGLLVVFFLLRPRD